MPAPPQRSFIVLAVVSCVVAATVAHGWRVYCKTRADQAARNRVVTARVTSGPFDHFVLEQGVVESVNNEYVVCEVQAGRGGVRILWAIPDGTTVKKGDILAELDSTGLEKLLTAQRVIVSGAEATLVRSQAKADSARIALSQYLDGTFLSDRKTILSQIAKAQQNVRKAELTLATTQRLAAKGTINELQIESARFDRDNAQDTLDHATERLRVLEQLTKEKLKIQLESNIRSAEARVTAHERVLQKRLDRQRQLEDQIAKCTIRAPEDGTVIHNNITGRSSSYEFIVEAGSYVRERQVLFKLPDLDRMQVKAAFNQMRITDVNEGMPARVTIDALPGVELLGKVTKVKKWPKRDRYGSFVREFTGYVEIIDPVETLRVGMTAEVQVYQGHIPDAVQVAIESVYEHLEHYFCLRELSDDQWETVEVTISETNDAMVVIDSGLSQGDLVALHPHDHRKLLELPSIDPLADRELYRKIGVESSANSPSMEAARERQARRKSGGKRGGNKRNKLKLDPQRNQQGAQNT